MLDHRILGEISARLMDKVDEEYGGDPTAVISDVLVIVGVERDYGRVSTLHVHCSDTRWYRGIGMLEGAKHSMLNAGGPVGSDDGD